MKGNHGNVRQVLKAHLVCEQQLRYDHLLTTKHPLIGLLFCS